MRKIARGLRSDNQLDLFEWCEARARLRRPQSPMSRKIQRLHGVSRPVADRMAELAGYDA
jgi:hypothetical protein